MSSFGGSDRGIARRPLLLGMLGLGAAATGALALPAPAAAGPADFGPGSRSGMPWHSGGSVGSWSAFEAFRGRPLDTVTCWCLSRTWSDIASLRGTFNTARRIGARLSLGLPPLPATHAIGSNPDSYQLAATGLFDGFYQLAAQRLAASGLTNVILRVGWEANHPPRPWYSGRDPDGFKATFQRIATIFRTLNPTIAIEWNNIRQGGYAGNILDTYPGDAFVDIVGISYYDGSPAKNSEAIWQRSYDRTRHGGPGDLGTWLAFARERKKPFAVAEWGIFLGRPGTFDNPFYIEKMHEFFTMAGADLAYENYFNQKTTHQIVPPDLNPNAAAAYRRLWGA